jgi:hypothetical protein
MFISAFFTKCKFTDTNLITYIDFIIPSVRSLCQADDSLFHLFVNFLSLLLVM